MTGVPGSDREDGKFLADMLGETQSVPALGSRAGTATDRADAELLSDFIARARPALTAYIDAVPHAVHLDPELSCKAAIAALARLEAQHTDTEAERDFLLTAQFEADEARERVTSVYRERDQLVAALSKLFPASLEQHEGEGWEDDWRWICFIDLPTGQATWHIHDSELPLFAHLPRETGRKWDGHTTPEKYERLNALARVVALEAHTQRLEGENERLRNVEAAAREVDLLFSDRTWRGQHRWTYAGKSITDYAAEPLLSLHDYLNDIDAAALAAAEGAEDA